MARTLVWTVIWGILSVGWVRLQVPGGSTLRVTVRDQTGAGIPGANVQARSESTGDLFQAESGDEGKATMDLAFGTYEILSSAKGFLTLKTRVEVKRDESANIVATLKVVSIVDPVEVITDDPGIWPEPRTLNASIPEEPLATLDLLPARSLPHHR